MKIGLINPWKNAAETQAAAAIALVAEQLGHEAYVGRNTEEVLAGEPDFILSMSIFVPKLTGIPTYGLIHEPRDIYFQTRDNLRNLFTYDGFFTLSDRLREFTSDLLHAARRHETIGAFYCATAKQIEWESEPDFAKARLAYFGINWDRRHEELFRELDAKPWMEVYGPPRGWEFLSKGTYQGMVPFDGRSNLERYHAAGAGLCLMTERHLADDVISGRIFEITASGAVAIAPKMPWLIKNFGDSLLYVDQNAPHHELAEQIESSVEWIHAHPREAAEKARQSSRIFRESFSMDVQLRNVLAYHEEQEARKAATKQTGPRISVIVRCSDQEKLETLLESIVAQEQEDTELILVPAKGFEPVVPDHPAKFFKANLIVEGPGAVASNLLWQSLRRCTGEYVCVLDDECSLFPGHFSSLFSALRAEASSRSALCGVVTELEEPYFTYFAEFGETRRIDFFPLAADELGKTATSVPLAALLFERGLLDEWLLEDPQLDAYEDSYLALALIQRSVPALTYRATLLTPHREARIENQNDWARLHLRLFGREAASSGHSIDFEELRSLEITQHKRIRRSEELVEYLLNDYVVGAFEAEEKWLPVPIELPQTDMHLMARSRFESAGVLPVDIRPEAQPWAFGVMMHLGFPDDRPYVIKLHCRVLSGVAGFGVLNPAGDDFNYRIFVPSQTSDVVVSLPVLRPIEAGYVVVQAGDGREPVRVSLTKVELFAGTTTRQLPERLVGIHSGRVMHEDGSVEYPLRGWQAQALGTPDKWRKTSLGFDHRRVHLVDGSTMSGRGVFPIVVRPPDEPWAYGMQMALAIQGDQPSVLRIRCLVNSGQAGIGILNRAGDDFLYRILVTAQASTTYIYLPLVNPSEASALVVQSSDALAPVEVQIDEIELHELAVSERGRRGRALASPARANGSSASPNGLQGQSAGRTEVANPLDMEHDEDWIPLPLDLSREAIQLEGLSRFEGKKGLPIVVRPPRAPYANGAIVSFAFPSERPHVMRVHAQIEGRASFAVVRAEVTEPPKRVVVGGDKDDVVLTLPVSRGGDTGQLFIQADEKGMLVRLVVTKIELFE